MPRPKQITQIQDTVGNRGENIFELALTDYSLFAQPLFALSFLGEKWPAVDYYVELRGLRRDRLFFLAQVKATTRAFPDNAAHLRVTATKSDVLRLKQIPGPTYIFGVHEPSRRVFVRAIHADSPKRGFSQIAIGHELTPSKLLQLRNEVRDFWRSGNPKPNTSIFS
jgi:hypothetical protein